MHTRLTLVVIFVAAVASVCAGESSSANYTLEASVIGSAGAPCQSASYKLNSTLGQSTPIGVSNSASNVLEAGFWYEKISLEGDANGDCKVNVLDLIYIRNHLKGDVSSDPAAAKADVNHDGVVNVLDLIYVRNRLGTSC